MKTSQKCFSVHIEINRFDLEYVIGEKANLLSDEQMEQVAQKTADLISGHDEAFNDYLRLAYRECTAE